MIKFASMALNATAIGLAFAYAVITAHADGTTQLVPARDPHLHGYHAFYEPGSDTIYINRDHPVPECIAILEAHEEIHREQYRRGENIRSARAEREAREGSMSRSCGDAGRPPVFPLGLFTL